MAFQSQKWRSPPHLQSSQSSGRALPRLCLWASLRSRSVCFRVIVFPLRFYLPCPERSSCVAAVSPLFPLCASVRLSIWLIFQQFSFCVNRYLLPCLAKLLGHFPTPVNSLFPLERGRKNTNQNKKLRAPGNCRLALWTDFLTCFQPRGEKPLGSVLDTDWSCTDCARQTTRTFLISVKLFRVPWSVYNLCSTSRFGYTAQLILIRKSYLQWKYTSICSLFCRPNT